MDLTHSFRTLVQQETSKQHARLSTSEKPSTRPDLFPPKRPSLAHPTNAFLSEAYILAKHLHSLRQRVLDIRPAYLNLPQTARQRRAVGRTKLSDPERDEIDQSIKATVRSMLGQIQSLNELGDSMVEQIEDDEGPRELLRRFVGALDPRNAGRPAQSTRLSRRDSMAALHSSVVWWLNARLRRTHQIHAEMQDLYLQHKLERQRGLLQQQQHQREHTRNMRSSNLQRDDEVLQSLSPQQLQQLQAENETMVGEFEHMLDSVHDTQRSVAEISALQSQLATELNAQMQQTEQLYNEAVGAVGAVEKGNDFLVAARKNQASARKWVLFVFIMLSIVLLFLDWFD